MSENVIVAIIGALASVVGSYSLVNYRLKKLEEKVDKHNAWGEKFQAQVTDIAVIKNDISYIKNAISKLDK